MHERAGKEEQSAFARDGLASLGVKTNITRERTSPTCPKQTRRETTRPHLFEKKGLPAPYDFTYLGWARKLQEKYGCRVTRRLQTPQEEEGHLWETILASYTQLPRYCSAA